MDPNVTLREIERLTVGVQSDDNRREAMEYIQALLAWLLKGGFAPNWPVYPIGATACASYAREHYRLTHHAAIYHLVRTY